MVLLQGISKSSVTLFNRGWPPMVTRTYSCLQAEPSAGDAASFL